MGMTIRSNGASDVPASESRRSRQITGPSAEVRLAIAAACVGGVAVKPRRASATSRSSAARMGCVGSSGPK